MLIDVSAIDIIYENRDILSSSWKFEFIILRSVKEIVRKCKKLIHVEGAPYINETHRLFHFDCTHRNSGFV